MENEELKDNLKIAISTLTRFEPTSPEECKEVGMTCTMINEMLSTIYLDNIDMANKIVMKLAVAYIECVSLSPDIQLIERKQLTGEN